MHITAAQMRAARGMLDWSRDELAQASGVSAGTIRNLESGNLSPREKTTVGIRRAFEAAGISFLEGEGIRRERMDVKVIDGFDSCEVFFDTVLHTIKRKGGELLGVFKSQETMIKSFASNNDLALSRLESISSPDKTLKCTALIMMQSGGNAVNEYLFVQSSVVSTTKDLPDFL